MLSGKADAAAVPALRPTATAGLPAMILDLIKLFVLPLLFMTAALSDLFTMKIPNWIALAISGVFIVVALVSGMALADFGMHLAAGLLVLVVSFVFFSRGWIGGGDAKLAAAAAMWFGFSDLLSFLLIASVFGGVLTLLLLFFRTQPLPFVAVMPSWVLRLHDRATGIPYGIALAAAGLLVYQSSDWIKTVDLSRFAFG
jgi:prepilin peptidase CpaA